MRDVIIGTVEAVNQGTDGGSGLDQFASPMQQRKAVSLHLRIITDDGERYTVLLHGTRIEGAPPRPGDRVSVPATWRDGRLEVDSLQNLTMSGETVRSLGPGPVARGGYSFLLIFASLFIVACFAWVFYGFVDRFF
jgi:hypothetical protein